MAMVRHMAGTELTPERLAEIEIELEEASKRPYVYDPELISSALLFIITNELKKHR